MVKVSVVIPHYQDVERLDLCLTALERQAYPRADFEIIVSDNNSPRGLAEVERAVRGRAKLVLIKEKGAGPARNGGVAVAAGEVLAFTDSDCVPEPSWLEEGLEALRDYDFIGGRVDIFVEDPQRPTPTEAFEQIFGFNFEDFILNKGFAGAGNLFVPRPVFDRVGGFSNGVSEDVEWCFRARRMGFTLGYAPKAALGHPARRSWPELKRKWLRVNKETFLLMLTTPFGRLKWLLRSLAMPGSAIVHTPRVLASPKLPTFSARLGALAILYKLRFWRLLDGGALALGLRR